MTTAVVAAIALPLLLGPWGQHHAVHGEGWTALMIVTISVLNIEMGRLLEGGATDRQRPHLALSTWSFACAVLLPTWWLIPVMIFCYGHARWRGLRVPLWKWIGSASYTVLAGLTAAVTAHFVLGHQANLMEGHGARGVAAVVVGAAAFLLTETVLFHGSAYLNVGEDEAWLRKTLAGPSFYLTEAGVLLVGGLTAAIWVAGAWFLIVLLPVYMLAQRAVLHVPLRELADRDDKTGLLRFESWHRLATTRATRCNRKQQPWTVLIADLDRFKQFNDRWGHLAGDVALAATARAIERQLRADDVLGRFGGEEYCIFLSDTGLEQATAVAERLREAVETMELPLEQSLTISVGLTAIEVASGGVDILAALEVADSALYDAKRSGRNIVSSRNLGP